MAKKSARFRFGEKVKKLRKKRGWTQAELAKRAGISKRYLQKIESKEPPDVTLDMIGKIAGGFNLTCYRVIE